MILKEAIGILHAWDLTKSKKLLAEIGKDEALKAEVLEYYADILKYTGGSNLLDILKVPKNLSTKKVRVKPWEPNGNSIETLNNLTIDYLTLSSGDKIPDWIRHTHFKSLTIIGHQEKDLVFPISATTFELRECGLKQVPEIIRNLKAESIKLSENEIETVPDWVFDIEYELDLSENKIEKIELKDRCRLRSLRLSDNQITDLSFLNKLPEITSLELNNNPISDFPELNESKIESLDLSNCNFSEIPECISNLKNLWRLELEENPITEISALSLPNLEYLNITSTPFGEQNNIEDTLSEVELQEFLQRNVKSDDNFIKICKMLESRDSKQMQEAFNILKADGNELKKAEKRYLKFIQARLGSDATIFDLEKATLSPDEQEKLVQTMKKGSATTALGYLEDEETVLLVDFLGSAVESVVNFEDLKKQLSGCSTEEELISLGKKNLEEIKSAMINITAEYREGWFGDLLFQFVSFNVFLLSMDHTSFNDANYSPRREAFFTFLQCVGFGDYSIDVFQSDAPNLGEIFWLLPNIPKVIWFDVEPQYPVSPLAFKRSATLNENNQGKRIKSKLLSEVKL